MPSVKQTTVDPVATSRGMGSSDNQTLVASFPASPVHSGELTRDTLEKQFNELVLSGVVKNGMGIASFDRDYTGADSGSSSPDLKNVKTGPGGLPASPYVPNPASPGPGSSNPADLPSPPEGFGTAPSSVGYGVGVGSQDNPADSGKRISKHTLGSYGLGTSTPIK